MDNERNQRRFESVFSRKVRAGRRRTYFFDVRKTKGEDFYLTLTESTRRFNGDGYERHKIFLYKEDFNRFLACLEETVDYVKSELMPEYDYDEFTRRHEEWEARKLEEDENGEFNPTESEEEDSPKTKEAPEAPADEDITEEVQSSEDDDMSW